MIATDALDAKRALLLQLTPKQAKAATALSTGSTHAEAAELAGVSREAVTRWANRHPAFCAALDESRTALLTEHFDRASRIIGKALTVIEADLDGAGDPAAAREALRLLGMPLRKPPPARQPFEHLSAAEQRTRDALRSSVRLSTMEQVLSAEGNLTRLDVAVVEALFGAALDDSTD